MNTKKVFLSSTARDLEEYRKAASRAITGLGYCCVQMEDFGARDRSADKFCSSRVHECDLFVGIMGHLYGSCPDGFDQSYTEREYEAAIVAKIPRLIFIAPDNFSVPADLIESNEKREKQKAFRERVRKEILCAPFTSPESLAWGVTQAIRNEEHAKIQKRPLSRVPFLAPSLPEHFVPRPEKSGDIKRRLLNCNSNQPGVLVVSALHGLGGIGKTVLASFLAHDEDVQRRYSDGILWVTLGQKPDVLSQLSYWIYALGDDDFHPTTPDAASMHLRSLLHDKSALLVIDDAWDPAFVRPFLVGGSRCQVLITTRDSLIARAVGASYYNLDVMTQDQSLALLSKCLGCEFERSERQKALDLVCEVGHLPLALELAASQVRDGVSWSELLSDLKAEVARLEALDTPGIIYLSDGAERRNLSLRASFQLSLQRLPEEKRTAFIWLGVLPEDVDLNPKMTATLWRTDQRTAQDTLRYLRSKALLSSGGDLDGNAQTYRLHDLLHDLCRNMIIAPLEPSDQGNIPGLGLDLQEAHTLLLECYREMVKGGLWHTLPNDGYIHDHLVWHMEKADRIEDIHRLLCEETTDGKNAWYQTRESLGQTGGFIENVACCWDITEKCSLYKIKVADTADAASTIPTIGLEARYAIMSSSIYNLVSNIPPDLICGLVENKLWAPQRGMMYAQKIENGYPKVKALSQLLPYLSDHEKKDVLNECMAMVEEMEDEKTRAAALKEIILRHHETDKIPDLVDLIKDRNLRDRVLGETIPRLSDPRFAIDLIGQIEDDRIKGRVIVEIVPHLSEPQCALPAVDQIREDRVKSEVLADIAPHFSYPDELLASAYKIKNASLRRDTYKKIRVKNSKPENPTMIDKILNLLKKNSSEPSEKEQFESQKMDNLEQNLAEICQIKDDRSRDDAVAKIALNLLRSQDALDVIRQIKDVALRARILALMAPNFQEPQKTDALNEAFDLATEVENSAERTDVLKELTSTLSQLQKTTILKKLFAYSEEISDILARASFLAQIAPSLYEPFRADALKEALFIIEQVQDENLRVKALIEVLPNLSEPQKSETMNETFDIIRSIKDERVRARLIVKVASGPKNDANDVLDLIGRIEDEGLKDWALAETVPRLEPWNALTISRQIKRGHLRARALAETASKLPADEMSDTLNEALSVARSVENGYSKARLLAAVATKIPKAEDALSVAEEIGDDNMREKALGEILPKLSDPQKALLLAMQIKDEESKDRALAGISSEIAQPDVALSICGQIKSRYIKGRNLAEIASKLPEPKKTDAFKNALTTISNIEDDDLRTVGLVEIAPLLQELSAPKLHSIWSDMLHASSRKSRSSLLSDVGALAPVIFSLGGEEALLETARAIQDAGRWWP